jgi:hypothetical protein
MLLLSIQDHQLHVKDAAQHAAASRKYDATSLVLVVEHPQVSERALESESQRQLRRERGRLADRERLRSECQRRRWQQARRMVGRRCVNRKAAVDVVAAVVEQV